ncbi:MAG: glycosyltransferase family 4 protein, partial [Deltaproteobacteria bacterium]|nr:glycosyltransferase family 4 protein [Deltaproteobacteria bacterium]
PKVQSGTETVFERLLGEARAAGHEVRLVCGFRRDRALVPADAAAVDLRGKGRSAWAAMALGAVAEARRFSPDVVLSNSIEVLVPGVPTVTIVHDLNFGGAGHGAAATARRAFYRAQSRLLAGIVAVSEVTRANLVEAGIAPGKVTVVHNGVELDRFLPCPRAPDGRLRLVHVSRVLPGKAQHASIDALGRMRPDQRRDIELHVVGAIADRIYADQLRVQAHKLPVSFHFDVPDVVPHYQSSDIALFPTLMPEGFGFAAVEAMACGLPVVGYEEPAVREATGGHAVLVPRDDSAALRDALLRLAAHPAERARLGEAGRGFVQRYAWPRAWSAYEAILSAVR